MMMWFHLMRIREFYDCYSVKLMFICPSRNKVASKNQYLLMMLIRETVHVHRATRQLPGKLTSFSVELIGQ